MATLIKETKFMVFTSPDELRKLADTLEKRYREAKLGESLVAEVWRDRGVVVEWIIDQDKAKK